MRISDIGISGNYPYVERKVRKYLTIRAGDIYDQQVVDEQTARIREFYGREGWIGTKVSAYPEHKPDYNSISVHFKIDRGYLLRIKNIDVTGNYSLPVSLVASKINPWKPYTPRRLRESIRTITNVYRKKGYPLARVRVKDAVPDLKNHTIDIAIEIEEGPHVGIKFTGNEHIGGRRLKKALTIFNEGAIDLFELDESTKSLKTRYQEIGFPNAHITYNRKEVVKDNFVITFNIDEGKPEHIRKIDIEGNRGISSRRLRNEMVTKELSITNRGILDEKTLGNDLKRLKSYYISRGYLDAAIEPPRIEEIEHDTQFTVGIPVTEGNQVIINSISFSGDIHFPEKRLLKAIKSREGRPLDGNIMDEEKEAVANYFADHGYPYADVNLNVERAAGDGRADLKFIVNPGPFVIFGDISIVGDFLTSQKAIRKAIGIKAGDEFSNARLVNARNSLRRIGAFNSVSIDPYGMGEKATEIPLQVKLEESRPFNLDFEFGYSTDEKLTTAMTFTNKNSFGWGKTSLLRLTGGRRLSRAELGWIDPKFTGHDLEMSISGWLQYEDKIVFNYVQGGGGIGLFRKYHRTSFLARAELDRNYLLKGSSTAASAESLRNNTIVETSLSASFDTRNSFANPTKGFYTSGYSNFYNEIKGNDAHFVKLGLLGGAYPSFWGRITFANDVRFEGIETFGKNVSVPSNELLLLGGDDTVRGFEDNALGPVNAAGKPTGGRLRFICNNEFRIALFGPFQWIIFHDMGFLTNNFETISLDQLRNSAGFGLHYITPIGPIKFDYGFILDRKPGEHIGRLHITFGYVF